MAVIVFFRRLSLNHIRSTNEGLVVKNGQKEKKLKK